jgi:GDP-L-fucose synthase
LSGVERGPVAGRAEWSPAGKRNSESIVMKAPNTEQRLYIAGHRGMVGAAIVRRLKAGGSTRLVTRTHAELDLTDAAAVEAFFAAERPTQVYLAAAKVGGIWANDHYPAEFIYQNLMIETNLIHAAWRHGVERLLFLGSSCIYPRSPYAVAKL